MNIYSYLIKNSLKFKNKNAIIYDKTYISYFKLLNLVDYYSKKFKKDYKIKSYDKISVLMENSIEYIIIILIACKLNITVQTLGTYYSKRLINSRIKKFKPKFIFIKDYNEYLLYDKHKKDLKFFEINEKKILKEKIKKKFLIKRKFNEELLAVESSGTTGSSKTVLFSETCKINRSLSAIETYKLNKDDVFISTAPFDHSVGHRQIFLPIILGSTNILLKNFHPKIWLESVHKYQVSFTLLISTQITKILNYVKLTKKNTASLKNLVSVSTKLNEQDKKKLLKFDFNLHEMYGTCEVGTATSINLKTEKNKIKSVGRPLENYKIKIINGNKFCKPNMIGEIICNSPNKFKKYMGSDNKKKNKFFFKNYFKTGDMGYLDNDNYLFFVGRKKNIVKINGLSVYPEEIEKKIKKKLNYINFVITSFKVRDEIEELVIYVEKFSKLQILKLKNFFNLNLEKYEIPKKIINIKKLPRTNLGKINIPELKKNEI